MAGWESVEEIDAYVMAVDVRDSIFRLTQSGPAAKDSSFRGQIRESSSSATKNLAEGFDRYSHTEFAQFASIAKGSIGETIDALKDGHERGYFSVEDFHRLLVLATRARKATGGLIRYLRSSEAPGETRGHKKRPRPTKHA